MPIYEYRCQSCGHELEKLQRLSDANLTDCPECGKSALKRLVSAAGFRLKGAGWYETDFKTTNQRNLVDSGSEKSANNESAKTESAKTESATSSSSEGKSSDTKSSDKKGSESNAAKAEKPAKPSSSSSAAST